MAKYYLTTAIPYVNGSPHIGHALEYVQADAIHRYRHLMGDDVLLISGSDENAIKNIQAAEKEGMEPTKFLDRNSAIFRKFYQDLGVELDEFRRGTDQKLHWPGVGEIWRRCDQAGDIYKKSYRGLYCVGCEQFYLPKDLIDGKCPNHLKEPEVVSEVNYFFRLAKYQTQLEKLIGSDQLKIIPSHRKNEVLSFIRQGLEDFSISRSNQRAGGIGVPVPGDDSQKMYVWFDALTIYMTAVGYGYDQKLWGKWWPADLHVIGKDIIRFHCVYWPAMLLSAGLPLPKSVFSHGFITSGGQKMSKTIGNVIDPYDLIKKYGVEALRYYLLREIPPFDDGDITLIRFSEVYQSDLANGLGNLVQRVAKLCELKKLVFIPNFPNLPNSPNNRVFSHLDHFEFNLAIEELWKDFSMLDAKINADKLWEKSDNDARGDLQAYVETLLQLAVPLSLFLPQTATKIQQIFKGPKISAPSRPLFPRFTSP